jgi:hypothetical protein
MLEQPAPLKVCVWMNNGVQIRSTPRPLILDLFDFRLVPVLKDPIAGNMIPLLLHIVSHCFQQITILDTNALEERREVLRSKGAVWATVSLARTWKGLGEDLLARVGRVSAAAAVGIAAHVTVRVPDIVSVLFLELVVCHELEGLPPKYYALIQAKADTLEK